MSLRFAPLEQFRVQGIVLGAAGTEGFAVTGQRFRINRVQRQEVIHYQRVDDGAARLFDGDADRAAFESDSQLSDPIM